MLRWQAHLCIAVTTPRGLRRAGVGHVLVGTIADGEAHGREQVLRGDVLKWQVTNLVIPYDIG